MVSFGIDSFYNIGSNQKDRELRVMTTIADIAKIAGVAKSTVSRYLNGGSISEPTKRKIEKVIDETGYSPNTFAQSLKAKKTNIIGVIVPRLDSYAASRTMIGIDQQLRDLNCQMLISNSGQEIEREIENIYTLSKQKVAGMILLATEITDKHIEAFEAAGIPVMLVGQQHEKHYSLIHNDFDAAFEIGRHVLEKGHKRIAYLGVTEKDIAVGVKRKEGFQAAIEHRNVNVKFFKTKFSINDAVDKASEIIDLFKPTVIVCATDNIAIGALKAAYNKGMKVPEDLSITGFGGYEITEMMNPGLTTAKFFYKEAGEIAATNIVKAVMGEEIPLLHVSNFKIIERESVDNLE
ncbi:LacI family DNA-binding transcriptional regulator [Mesobacillus foraminis]|nr:LacI family DNA-binding transcriptional regulator [Mesobacillus foraminis]